MIEISFGWFQLLLFHPYLGRWWYPIWWNIYIYTYVYIYAWNPNDLYFWRSTPQNKAFSNQNKGHLGSRCIYTSVWWAQPALITIVRICFFALCPRRLVTWWFLLGRILGKKIWKYHNLSTHLSSDQSPGLVVLHIGDERLPSYIRIIMSHYKDPH